MAVDILEDPIRYLEKIFIAILYLDLRSYDLPSEVKRVPPDLEFFDILFLARIDRLENQ